MRRLGQLARQLSRRPSEHRCGEASQSLLTQQAAPRLAQSHSAARFSSSSSPDVVIVGAGHNGLVAAALLARQGLAVQVVEQKDVIGGACRTEYPFSKVPGLGSSTGAYLLGLFPPELLQVGLPILLRQRSSLENCTTAEAGLLLCRRCECR